VQELLRNVGFYLPSVVRPATPDGILALAREAQRLDLHSGTAADQIGHHLIGGKPSLGKGVAIGGDLPDPLARPAQIASKPQATCIQPRRSCQAWRSARRDRRPRARFGWHHHR
jgi:hypothetical protein